MQTKLFHLLIIICCFFSCMKEEKIENSNINELKQRINIDGINPISVRFSISELGQKKGRAIGPNDYDLQVILKLSESDYQNLKENYSKNKVNIGDKVYLNKDFIKPWFTNSIKESFFLEDDYYRIRSEVYFPDRFLKSPFTGGFLFFTVDHQVFIYMYTT
ncbi:hypothetical protein [Flavobacterium sp. KBS0721]|jgi:hypothetical protein|uniref:hypothetical protein n=1 Tax=Flavobacterium sp. KBS0721 TaxID=1179672 RepID=UPI000F4F0C30|nr:hypothetical protein [Flavobacterium sp. KBS0721]QDW22572.1 hypothetical protein B0M43_0021430 [Flavobacterium sp. KBS0721]